MHRTDQILPNIVQNAITLAGINSRRGSDEHRAYSPQGAESLPHSLFFQSVLHQGVITKTVHLMEPTLRAAAET
jgi:hypothetical protein